VPKAGVPDYKGREGWVGIEITNAIGGGINHDGDERRDRPFGQKVIEDGGRWDQHCVIPAVDEQEYGIRSADAGVTGWGVDPDLILRRKDVAAQAMCLQLAGWDAGPPGNVWLWRGGWHLDH
jgi:hypothetical protein